jgi:quinol monooxygenase YgiN
VKYTVTVRARLKQDQKASKDLHDRVTGATKDAAKQAGDLTHRVFLDPQDGRAFFGVDEWSSLEGVQRFAGSPEIKKFFADLFEGEPEVRVWVDSGWNQW